MEGTICTVLTGSLSLRGRSILSVALASSLVGVLIVLVDIFPVGWRTVPVATHDEVIPKLGTATVFGYRWRC